MSSRVLERQEVLDRQATDACVIEAGELVNLAHMEPEELDGCHFKNESGFVLYAVEPEEEQEKQEKPQPKPRKKPVKTEPISTVEEVVPASTPEALLSIIPDGGVPSVEALVAAPANLQAVLPKAADTSGLTVLMAVVAVAGGGAAWKFYDSYSKRKHEENMARIERGDDQHGACKAERAALDAKLSQVAERLEGALRKLDEVAKGLEQVRSESPSLGGLEPDVLEERLEKLEKAFKVSKKKGKA